MINKSVNSTPLPTPFSGGLPVITENIEIVRVNELKQVMYGVEDLGGNVTLEMVYIPDGTFMMGFSPEEKEAVQSDSPQHEVIVLPFSMSRYPVTQRQWRAVMDTNPSHFKGDNRPVERVSWNDTVEFCQRLFDMTDRDYRIPSEAEWEYACRARTITPYYFGEGITTELANYNSHETTDVGDFPPNAFGLYDMHGNVFELCSDSWNGADEERVVTRGGAFDSNEYGIFSFSRSRILRDKKISNCGFRLCADEIE